MVAPLRLGSAWIYVIAEVDTDFCKVGMTQGDLGPRVHKLQTGNPRQLELVSAVHGDIFVERALHEALLPFRVKREWFQPKELVRLIFETMQEALLDEGDELGLTFERVTDHMETAPVSVETARRSAAATIAYWNSPERLEDEAYEDAMSPPLVAGGGAEFTLLDFMAQAASIARFHDAPSPTIEE